MTVRLVNYLCQALLQVHYDRKVGAQGTSVIAVASNHLYAVFCVFRDHSMNLLF